MLYNTVKLRSEMPGNIKQLEFNILLRELKLLQSADSIVKAKIGVIENPSDILLWQTLQKTIVKALQNLAQDKQKSDDAATDGNTIDVALAPAFKEPTDNRESEVEARDRI